MLAIPKTTIPPPHCTPHLLLAARWKGASRTSYGGAQGELKHVYDLTVMPDEPITIGRRVRILAVTPIAYALPQVPPDQLDTYDPHIVGRVAEITRLEDGHSCARVMNQCKGNAVTEVELEYPDLREARKRMGRRRPTGNMRANDGEYAGERRGSSGARSGTPYTSVRKAVADAE
ncbi:hypothetical protein C8T65DRAFT_701071 [Cerioporus squamosus]|nr:hypothetical protein C8T65DRAFT_701071 [Cerioporus squamosus]